MSRSIGDAIIVLKHSALLFSIQVANHINQLRLPFD